MSCFGRRRMLLPALLLSIAACDTDVTHADANALLLLDVVHGEGVDLSRIDQGRVFLDGPTPRDEVCILYQFCTSNPLVVG